MIFLIGTKFRIPSLRPKLRGSAKNFAFSEYNRNLAPSCESSFCPPPPNHKTNKQTKCSDHLVLHVFMMTNWLCTWADDYSLKPAPTLAWSLGMTCAEHLNLATGFKNYFSWTSSESKLSLNSFIPRVSQIHICRLERPEEATEELLSILLPLPQSTMLLLSIRICLKSSKLRPILNGQFCHAMSKNICLNVLGSKQPWEI